MPTDSCDASWPEVRAPRYFLDESARFEDADERVVIGGGKASRLKRVMRVRRDDPLELLHPPTDRLYHVVVERVTGDEVHCRVVVSRPRRALPPPRIVLSAALIRPQRYDFIIEKATELGVDQIRPVQSERALIRGEAGQRLGRWRRLATEAAEQCRREYLPEISAPAQLDELVTSASDEDDGASTLRLLASAIEPDQRIASVFEELRGQGVDWPERVHLLIGPEGGFTPEEARLARDNGWRPISLGNRPLRAETAAIVAVALTLEASRG